MENQPIDPPCLLGERVYLRGIQLSDVNDRYYHWMNDPEVVRFTESRFSRYTVEDLKNYINNLGRTNNLFLTIVCQKTRAHIGNLKIGSINWIHRYGDLGIVIGRKDYWGKGYATESIQLAADYAFKILKLHKILAGVYVDNVASMKAFSNAGFEIEGKLKSHYNLEGKYVDSILLGRLNDRI